MAKTPVDNDPTSDRNLRIAFHKLKDEIAEIEKKTGPMTEAYDALESDPISVAERLERQREITEDRKAIELAGNGSMDLYAMKDKLARIATVLGRKTGNPDGSFEEPSDEEKARLESLRVEANRTNEARAKEEEQRVAARHSQRRLDREARREARRAQ